MTVNTPDHGCSPEGTTCPIRTRLRYTGPHFPEMEGFQPTR